MAWSWDGASLDVQLGLGSPPATPIASITWTTITDYVRRLSFGNGKSDELDSYQAGRLSMTLDNRDRRFDPLHATGPYFGNLKPMVPVRVRFTYGGTTTTLWTGFVSGFPQTYDPPNDAMVNVTATDGFAVLQRTRLPSLYASEVAPDTPSLWWRLGEQVGITAVDASGNHNDGTYVGGATFNSVTGLTVDTDNAIEFSTSQAAYTVMAWPAFPFSVELWFSTPIPSDAFGYTIFSARAATDLATAIQVTVISGIIFVAAGNSSGAQLTRQSTAATYQDGQTHHIVATWTNGTTAPTLYIDGVVDAGTPSATPTVPAFGSIRVVAPFGLADYAAHPFTGTVDEVAVYPSALSAARVSAHYNAGHAPLVGLDTGAAITKVLDLIGWPTADRAIETGKSTVVSFDMSGRTALDVIRDLEETEQGRFFIDSAGVATFYNRHHVLTTAASATSQATFGDTPAELPYGDLELEFGEDQIRNSITTQRVGGSPFLARDATSVTSYREREFSITKLLNSSDGEISDLGNWVLGHYKDPLTRVPKIVLKPRMSPSALFPHIRSRKLLDRVTVKRRPQNVGSAISIDVLIEGVQHDVTLDEWTTQLLLSPAEIQSYFVLDHTTLGRLDNNRLAF